MKRIIAECLGTFILVLFGTGTAVLGNGMGGIGTMGIALVFGLTIAAVTYSIGTTSGAHLNLTISLGMWLNRWITTMELIYYVVEQIAGGLVALFALLSILKGADEDIENLGQDGVGELSVTDALTVEIILIFIFVLVVMTVTNIKKDSASLAEIVTGLALTMIHLVGIPLTGISVNPARNIVPATPAGSSALSELWISIVTSLIGGLLATLIAGFVLDTEK